MGFELFKSRKETIDQATFSELLKDQQVQMEVNAVLNELDFMHEEGEGNEEYLTHIEPKEGYRDAINALKNTLDLKGVVATKEAVISAVLEYADPDGSKGYLEHNIVE